MTDSYQKSASAPDDVLHFPCTANQRRYLAVDRNDEGRLCLNAAFCYRVEGGLRDSLVERAFQTLRSRHEILRTRFVTTADGPAQEVVANVPAKVSVIDMSQLKAEMAEKEMIAIAKLEVSKPFDLSKAPLIRLTLLKMAPNDTILLITSHAAVIDGWSISIIVDELGQLIQSYEADQSAKLANVEMQFGDYARWQQEMIAGDGYSVPLDYWRDELAELPQFRVAPSKIAPFPLSYASLIRGVILPRELTDRVDAYAKGHGKTFFHMALASLAAMLHDRTGAPEVVIATQVTGREQQASETIVGPLLNCVVLRIATKPSAPLSGIVDEAARKSIEALTHQSAPFECVVDLVAPGLRDHRQPVCAINFALQAAFIHDNSATVKKYGRFEIHSMPSQSAAPIWDLNFALVERPQGWRMSCEADADLFDEAAIDGMIAGWQEMMSALLSAPDARLSDGLADAGGGRLPANTGAIPARSPAKLSPKKVPFDQDRILVLQKQGSGIPIIGLNVTAFHFGLAKLLPERRFLDIMLPDTVPPKRVVPRAMTDLAADAVQLIRRARPRGPYVLLGLCVVGAVAIEAARVLQDEGEDVPLIILNDTWAPGFREDMTKRDKLLRQLQHRKYNFGLDLAARRRGEISTREMIERTGLLNLLSGRSLTGDRSMRELEAATEGYSNGWYMYQLIGAYKHHRPEPYHGRVVHFRTTLIPQGRLFHRNFGWDGLLLGGHEVLDLPGDHITVMREPAVGVLAEGLRPILQSIDTDHGLAGRQQVGHV